jgi:hypothetical protein
VRPGALTQAARSAAVRREAPQPRHEPRAKRPARPPRRVSGPVGGKEGARRTSGATRTAGAARGVATRTAGGARGVATARVVRTTRVAASFRTPGAPRMVAAARAAAVALPLPLPAFRRAPGPVIRPRPRPAPAPRPREQTGGLARRAGAFVVSLPDHAWLDRVVRGRVWIPLLGVLLAGIVAMQVEILKSGASMGRSLEQTSALTNQNEQLRDNVAALADDQRIERLAGAMGLVLPPPGSVGYLVAERGGNLNGALANLHKPDSYSFVTMTPKNGAVVTGQGTSTLPPTPGAPVPPATTSTTSSTSATGTSASATTPTSTTATTPSSTSSTGTSTVSAGPTTTAAQTTTTAPPTSSTSPAGTTTSQTPATSTSTQVPATGAAAIQPAYSTQSSGGG